MCLAYLLDHNRSDHSPFQWLHRIREVNTQITCWDLALQPFKFEVYYSLGTVAEIGRESATDRMAPQA